MAERGAETVGLDLSPTALSRAKEVLGVLGLESSLVLATLEESEWARHLRCHSGCYALHHTDVAAVAPLLAGVSGPARGPGRIRGDFRLQPGS